MMPAAAVLALDTNDLLVGVLASVAQITSTRRWRIIGFHVINRNIIITDPLLLPRMD